MATPLPLRAPELRATSRGAWARRRHPRLRDAREGAGLLLLLLLRSKTPGGPQPAPSKGRGKTGQLRPRSPPGDRQARLGYSRPGPVSRRRPPPRVVPAAPPRRRSRARAGGATPSARLKPKPGDVASGSRGRRRRRGARSGAAAEAPRRADGLRDGAGESAEGAPRFAARLGSARPGQLAASAPTLLLLRAAGPGLFTAPPRAPGASEIRDPERSG